MAFGHKIWKERSDAWYIPAHEVDVQERLEEIHDKGLSVNSREKQAQEVP